MVRATDTENRGFTVVEVMVAMLVLSVGLLGLLAATANSIRVMGESDRALNAAYFANEQLEQLLARGCDDAASGSAAQQIVYALTWTVSGTPSSRVRDVHLQVSYPVNSQRIRTDAFEKAMPCMR